MTLIPRCTMILAIFREARFSRLGASCTKLFLLVCLTLAQASYAEAPQVKIASGEWLPYLSENLPGGGPVAELVTAAFNSQGWQVHYSYYPWARSLELAREGNVDATLIWSKNPQRAQSFLFSNPVIRLITVVFYNKASPLHWQKPADLKGKRLGAVTGYSYGFVTPVDGYQLNYVSDPVSNFRKLAAGRLDGVLEELQVGEMLIHNIGAQSRLAYDSKPVKDNPFFLMAGKNNPRAKEVLEVFNQGLALLRSNGRYDTLLEISSQGNSE